MNKLDQNCIFEKDAFFEAFPDQIDSDKISIFSYNDQEFVYVPNQEICFDLENYQTKIKKLVQTQKTLYKDTVEALFVLANADNCTIQDIIDERKLGFELQAESSSESE